MACWRGIENFSLYQKSCWSGVRCSWVRLYRGLPQPAHSSIHISVKKFVGYASRHTWIKLLKSVWNGATSMAIVGMTMCCIRTCLSLISLRICFYYPYSSCILFNWMEIPVLLEASEGISMNASVFGLLYSVTRASICEPTTFVNAFSGPWCAIHEVAIMAVSRYKKFNLQQAVPTRVTQTQSSSWRWAHTGSIHLISEHQVAAALPVTFRGTFVQPHVENVVQ